MSAAAVAATVFLCLCTGMWLGMFLRKVLPDPHLKDESKDAIRISIGLIATLTALVLGLLIASTKSSHDAVNAGLVQASARIVLLDRVLAQYGPEAANSRRYLRDSLAAGLERYWPEQNVHPAGPVPPPPVPMEAVYQRIQQLAPQNDAQRGLQTRALQIAADLMHSRWQLLEEAHSEVPMPFLIVVVFWLTTLFVSFSLFAPRNMTVAVVFIFCAISVAAAIYLLIAMGHPSEGLMKVSPAPLLRAYWVLGR